MCICVFTNRTTFRTKQIHIRRCWRKNIRRDGKRRLVNLCIFLYSTTKYDWFEGNRGWLCMYNDWNCTIRIFGWCSWISGTKFYEFPNTWGLRMILIFSNGWFFNPLKRHFNVYTIAESHYSLLLFRVTGIIFSLWLCIILHFTALDSKN
jgi:hypothetical protein